ncbi:MAG: bifunctional folylpolyglutamate synthase/dihydrofolate synthase [Bacteroidales bacterium]|nr:bifunctional folylpolyglutamate synthase/dihydrofolate synthase [Lentimicrobiaceae bacterium]MDD5695721.1 bifunctional folylpolyglutamate synthase/dihydrofolate synthase [Bacteroidales bacterium]
MYHRIGAAAYKADLKNTLALCQLLDNPHQAFSSIHVAGTNGKGSVSHWLASILQEAGLKVGLYTSPHLVDFRERIRINREMIPREKVTSFVQLYKEAFDRIHLSFFEMTVGLAFSHFREEKVDIAVLETGLGGRLDSTNVVTPVLSVITNIGHDHQAFLGDTLEKIAVEKAGIIKPNVPVVIGETQNETADVFLGASAVMHAPILFADQHFSLLTSRVNTTGNILDGFDVFRDGIPYLLSLESPLKGYYQVRNIVTVLQSAERLAQSGYPITVEVMERGIRRIFQNTGLMGRWQIIGRNPLIICDVGHNPEGLQYNVNQLTALNPGRLHIVFGMVSDKDDQSILSLLPGEAIYYFCKADIPRAMDAHLLASKAHCAGLQGKAYRSVRNALASARRKAHPNDVIFVGGSTFVVSEVLSPR